ncbi:hypothetical protein [Chromobacterium piscinae]|uniref:hypothetical protein n=1 Tax=Chromobacterium piscinae TaxID=686831 RepID=UPI00320B8045
MGEFSKEISRRILDNKKHKFGYCVICGNHGELSKDHVPPQSLGNVGSVELLTLSEYVSRSNIKPLSGKGGAYHKTICRVCNGDLLSRLDMTLKVMYEETFLALSRYEKNVGIDYVKFNVDPKEFCRCMMGHLTATSPQVYCEKPIPEKEHVSLIRNFILKGGDEIIEDYDFYLWFYPYKNVVAVNNMIGLGTNGVQVTVYLLKFLPFGFAMVSKGSEWLFSRGGKIDFKNNYLRMSLNPRNLYPQGFLNGPGYGLGMALFAENTAGVSRKAKGSL